MRLFILEALAPFCTALFSMSCTATLVGACILLLRYFFDAKTPPQWKSALWWLVLLALIVPYRIPSSISLLPTAHFAALLQEESVLLQDELVQMQSPTQAISQATTQTYPQGEGQTPPQGSSNTDTSTGVPKTAPDTVPQTPTPLSAQALICTVILPSIWLLGVLVIVIYQLLNQWYLHRRLCTTRQPCTQQTAALFAQAKNTLHMTASVDIFAQDYIKTPAITGLLRPAVVLPDYAQELPAETLRFILLHELSHAKRKDLWLNALLLLLQTAHWFNPMVWFLLRLVRQDIELCNDTAVLRALGQQAQKKYSLSLLTVLGEYNHTSFAPRLLCMADGKDNLKRRIQMMQSHKQFQKHRIAIALAYLAVIGVLVALFFTKPAPAGNESTSSPTPSSAITDNSTNSSAGGDSESTTGTSTIDSTASSDTSTPNDASSNSRDDTSSADSSTSSSTATSITPATPVPTSILMMLEGMEEKVPAERYQKDGYQISVPCDEWAQTAENSWQAKENDTISFTVHCLPEADLATVATSCWGEAGEECSWLELPARYFDTADGQSHFIFSVGHGINTYYYMQMQCPAEAIEGYGTRMAYIAANICVSRTAGSDFVSFAEGLGDTTYTVFDSYSINDENNLTASFCISDTNGKEIQTITYPTHFNQSWYNTYLDNGGTMVRFLDVNLDGHLDFVGQVFGAMVDQSYQVWLYQQGTGQFAYSEEYSQQTNPIYHPQTKRFLSTSYYDQGLPFYSLFQIENGHLAYLGSVQGALTKDGNVEYIERMYAEQVPDGSITYREVQTMETVTTPEECSPLWDGFPLLLETAELES